MLWRHYSPEERVCVEECVHKQTGNLWLNTLIPVSDTTALTLSYASSSDQSSSIMWSTCLSPFYSGTWRLSCFEISATREKPLLLPSRHLNAASPSEQTNKTKKGFASKLQKNRLTSQTVRYRGPFPFVVIIITGRFLTHCKKTTKKQGGRKHWILGCYLFWFMVVVSKIV